MMTSRYDLCHISGPVDEIAEFESKMIIGNSLEAHSYNRYMIITGNGAAEAAIWCKKHLPTTIFVKAEPLHSFYTNYDYEIDSRAMFAGRFWIKFHTRLGKVEEATFLLFWRDQVFRLESEFSGRDLI